MLSACPKGRFLERSEMLRQAERDFPHPASAPLAVISKIKNPTLHGLLLEHRGGCMKP